MTLRVSTHSVEHVPQPFGQGGKRMRSVATFDMGGMLLPGERGTQLWCPAFGH